MSREPATPVGVEMHPGSGFSRISLTADRGDHGVRLDLVVLRRVGTHLGLSRRRIQQSIENGDVGVNGATITRTAARVAAGDRIDATLPAAARREPAQAQDLPLEVLFEDDHLLAVNKPPGMVSHPSYKHTAGTLLNALLWRLRGTRGRPRLLGRLDKDTSGIVLVSKTPAAHAGVVRAMRAGQVRKEYLAVVHGAPRPARGEIALALARDPADVRRVAVCAGKGKESVTRYETVSTGRLGADRAQAEAGARTPWLSLVRCELVTGRMHQIRVHLAARGWPIVGDATYGPVRPSTSPGRTEDPGAARVAARHALHAWRLSLAHPVTGAPLVIVAPIPDDMRTLIAAADLTDPATRFARSGQATND